MYTGSFEAGPDAVIYPICAAEDVRGLSDFTLEGLKKLRLAFESHPAGVRVSSQKCSGKFLQ